MTPRTPAERATGANPCKLVNWDWTIADMDRMEVMVRAQRTASQIADAFGSSAEEIRAVCDRNGFAVCSLRRHA